MAALALLLGSSIAWAQAPKEAAEGDSAQVTQELSAVKSLIGVLRSDVATLEFLARGEGGYSVESGMFDQVAGRISDLRGHAAKLDGMRTSGSPAQQRAVERLVPVMQEFASSADAAVKTSRTRQNQSNLTAFRQYMKLSTSLADELSSVISTWIGYAQTRGDLDRVARQIGAPIGSQ